MTRHPLHSACGMEYTPYRYLVTMPLVTVPLHPVQARWNTYHTATFQTQSRARWSAASQTRKAACGCGLKGRGTKSSTPHHPSPRANHCQLLSTQIHPHRATCKVAVCRATACKLAACRVAPPPPLAPVAAQRAACKVARSACKVAALRRRGGGCCGSAHRRLEATRKCTAWHA